MTHYGVKLNEMHNNTSNCRLSLAIALKQKIDEMVLAVIIKNENDLPGSDAKTEKTAKKRS